MSNALLARLRNLHDPEIRAVAAVEAADEIERLVDAVTDLVDRLDDYVSDGDSEGIWDDREDREAITKHQALLCEYHAAPPAGVTYCPFRDQPCPHEDRCREALDNTEGEACAFNPSASCRVDEGQAESQGEPGDRTGSATLPTGATEFSAALSPEAE